MSACLWDDIDECLRAAALADMGSAGSYTTLVVAAANIHVGEYWDVDHWQMPALAIIGLNAGQPVMGPHGDGVAHIEQAYPYTLVGLATADTLALALSYAKELRRRWRELLRTRYALDGLTATDGETVIKSTLNESYVEVLGPHQGKYLGAAYQDVTFTSQI